MSSSLKAIVDRTLNGATGNALCYADRWYGWSELRDAVDRLKTALLEAGVTSHGRVAVMARNTPTTVVALLATLVSEHTLVMIYAYQSGSGIAKDIRGLNIDAVIGDVADWSDEAVLAAESRGVAVIVLHSLTDLVEIRRKAAIPRPARIEKPSVELLTSGTTGPPKRISLSYAAMERAMIAETSQVAMTNASVQPPALIMFPFGNISGIYSYLPTVAGAKPVVLLEKFSVAGWVGFVREFRPATMNIPPAGVAMLLDAQVDRADLASVKYMFSGAARLDPKRQEEFLQRYDIPILLAYGATEFGGVLSTMTPALYEQFGPTKLGSVGRPWAEAEIRIIDAETGSVLRPEEIGVIEINAPRCGPDWIRTTDLGVMDADGFLYHRGRADGTINRGGFKISPDQVADALLQHPSAAGVAVVGIADERLGEVPVAALELRPGAARPSIEELTSFAHRMLAKTQVPARFKVVDQLPRTASLKVDLAAVRSLFGHESK